jgi:hypothetical protein
MWSSVTVGLMTAAPPSAAAMQVRPDCGFLRLRAGTVRLSSTPMSLTGWRLEMGKTAEKALPAFQTHHPTEQSRRAAKLADFPLDCCVAFSDFID